MAVVLHLATAFAALRLALAVPKTTKKGTYTLKVKVTAAGNANYKAGSKVITYKVVVK